ncbi:TetR/AcrR family transcriptional regulator [Loigolactobacillus bifermentans]|jgi:AcrR family transcriptional regulator|uniref:Uncharacterized protein n=1 Tax=Loigolactobacillus bifermentans DSM 20003 TaxID=1423726 RepID=A0A0R1H9B7_9LACO|nr:TetR/AcrR family transcriptional regulator [Loigolactobacillus bifermentans]KRK40612.1 hypothetical protein FC07_GL000020 [Loigolactobacillus bifermentans DSM 20003]QGG60708.1 TetR family transcriptional regulator [Loigolactobacillus bifermentans]
MPTESTLALAYAKIADPAQLQQPEPQLRLRACLAVFSTFGYQDTTFHELAKNLKIPERQLHKRFPSKLMVAAAILKPFLKNTLPQYLKPLTPATSLMASLEQIVPAFLRLMHGQPQQMQLLTTLMNQTTAIQSEQIAYFAQLLLAADPDHFQRLRQAHLISTDADTELLLIIFTAVTTYFTENNLFDPDVTALLSAEKEISGIIAFLTQALAATPEP